MLNSQLNSSQFNDAGINPGTSIDSGVITAKIGPDINASKYVFFQMDGTQIVKKINLADFFERNDNLGLFFLDDNIRDLPNKEIISYTNPFADGGEVVNEKLSDKEITLDLKVIASNHYDLEATLLDLKNRFNQGGKLQINENGYLRFQDVVLSNFEIKAEGGLGKTSEITVTFLSVHPIRKSSLQTIAKLAQQGDISISMSILDSHKDVMPEFQILIKGVTGTITSAILNYNGYYITYNGPLVEGDNLTILGETGQVLINGVESDFDGVITEIETGKQTILNIFFVGGTPDYSLYILYHNLYI